MADIQLHDSFELRGTKCNEFFDALESMDKITSYDTFSSEDIELLSVDKEKTTDTELYVTHHVGGATPKNRLLNIEKLREKGASDELIAEAINGNRLFMRINNKLYFTSDALFDTLSSRLDLKGGRLRTPSKGRDAYVIETMKEVPFRTRIMFRKDAKIKKVFSAFSNRYAAIPQRILKTVISNISDNGLDRYVCKEWLVTHSISEIYLEFPEKAKDFSTLYGLPNEVVPGLYLATSDTGNCSITARETWTVNGVRCFKNSFKREHKGKVDSLQILEEIDKNIFSNYTLVPEKLCELQMIEIKDVKETYKSIFEQIGVVAAVKKDIKKKLYEELCAEIDPALTYTAYDIAVTIMCLPGRCHGLSPSAQDNLNNIVIKAVFADYTKNEKKAEKIYLTA